MIGFLDPSSGSLAVRQTNLLFEEQNNDPALIRLDILLGCRQIRQITPSQILLQIGRAK